MAECDYQSELNAKDEEIRRLNGIIAFLKGIDEARERVCLALSAENLSLRANAKRIINGGSPQIPTPPRWDDPDSIDCLEFSARTSNILQYADIHRISELKALRLADKELKSLLRLPNCGHKSVNEIKAALDSLGETHV